MQCVILAGGLATRLGPHAAATPKHLLPVGGRPFAYAQLARLRELGARRVVYCVGHLGGAIRECVGNGNRLGLAVRYVDEGDALRGTAGALRLAVEQGDLDETFFMTYGDSLLRADLPAMSDRFAWTGAAAMMTVFRNQDRYDSSNVDFADGRVRAYAKEPNKGASAQPRRTTATRLDWIDYGLLLWRRDEAAACLPHQGDLAPALAVLARRDRLAGFAVEERFFEIGSPAGWAELDALLTPPPPAPAPRPLVILDRDGVLNAMVVDGEYGTVDSPLHQDQVAILPRVPATLREIAALGFDLAIASNQPAAAKGKTSRDTLERVHELVVTLAEAEGARIASSHLCFHRREDGCACRKPATGLLEAALGDRPPALRARSWMVGDRLVDVQAGRRAGMRTALLAPDEPDLHAIAARQGVTLNFWGEDLAAFARYLRERREFDEEEP